MSAFIKKIFETLAPESPKRRSSARPVEQTMSRQAILDALLNHFDREMKNESTEISMLFHTSFVVYLREEEYRRMSPSFLMTARDAVTLFLRRIKERLSKYPDYRPHSRYWVLQLVNIPEGTIIDGIEDDDMDSDMILIKSTLFPEDEYDSSQAGGVGEGRVVTTLHTKNSMKALPKAMHMNVLLGLDQLAKDKYRIKFDQNDVLGFGDSIPFETGRQIPLIPTIPAVEVAPVARLTADDGRFIDNGRTFTTYQMNGDMLKIFGRNGNLLPGESILKVDSDEVMNPHCIIRRDTAKNTFFICAYGPVRLNERSIPSGGTQWILLPDRSAILLNEEVQISFRIL